MKTKYFEYLVDPITGVDLKLNIYAKSEEEVIDGMLNSKDSWYPIIGGIPRMLTGKLKKELLCRKVGYFKKYKNILDKNIVSDWKLAIKEMGEVSSFDLHQQKTADSFAYEWKNIYQENDYEKNNFYHFLHPFLKEKDLRGKVTLDIGCGSGRFTKWAAKADTKISFATDLGDSVEVAYQMTKEFDNVAIVQADIYSMPFSKAIDVAYCIGVLHHLPQPRKGFLSLVKVLRDGGRMLIWVYSRRNNNRALYVYEPMRYVCRMIPKPVLFKLCYFPATVVHLWNLFCKALGLKNMPFSYYENFSFNMKLNDSFDVLATPKSNYYFSEEIEGWFHDGGLKSVNSFEHPEAGITCIGVHE